jgi:hypothetical protein
VFQFLAHPGQFRGQPFPLGARAALAWGVVFDEALKMIINPALLQNFISRVTRLDFTVDCYMAIGNRTIPNIMVAFSPPLKATSVLF